jgi:Carbohydrate binding module (family 6)./F5/8 type C domain.
MKKIIKTILSIGLIFIILFQLTTVHATNSSTDWFSNGKYGIDGPAPVIYDREVTPGKTFDQTIKEYDANSVAYVANESGAAYVIINAVSGDGHFIAPNATFDSIVGSSPGERCSTRDTIDDIYNALNPYGVKLILYVIGDIAKLDGSAGTSMGWDFENNCITSTFLTNMKAVYKEWYDRYGSKVAGWWVDGCYDSQGCTPQVLNELADSLRSGNSNAIICFNKGLGYPACFAQSATKADYTAGELYGLDYPCTSRWINGLQWHHYLPMGAAYTSPQVLFSNTDLINYINTCNANGGVVTINSSATGGGTLAPQQLEQLRMVKACIRNGQTPTEAPTPTPAPEGLKLEAESFYNSSSLYTSGISRHATYVTSSKDGDWLAYNNLNLGNGYSTLIANLAVSPRYEGRQIEIRLDSLTGTLMGTLTTQSTGGENIFRQQRVLLSGANGLHTVYFIFKGNTEIGKMDWFKFDGYNVSGLTSLTFNKTVTVSSFYNTQESGPKAVDGLTSTKWCSSAATEPHWIQVDLGQSYDIGRWVVKHSGEGGEDPNCNTRDFKLQKSPDGVYWTDVDMVAGNTANVTDRIVPTFNSRYVRLYITKATNISDTHARIYEFDVYEPVSDNMALGKSVTVSSYNITQENGSMAVDGSATTKWCSDNVAEPHWLQVDLGQACDIGRWVVKHCGEGGESTDCNTKDFKLQKSSDGVNWTDVDSVIGNTANVTDREVAPFNSRYVRLYITKATSISDVHARIYEFALYKPKNLAFGKTVSVSSYYNTQESGPKAVDGSTTTKWCSGNDAEPHWLQIDLGQSYDIGRWVVKHCGAGGESPDCNTRDFKLQKSSDGINWTDVDTVTGNTANITDRYVATFNSRYIRLYITKATSISDTHARIYEFEVYAPETCNLALNKTATTSSDSTQSENGAKAVDGNPYNTKWCSWGYLTEPHWLQVDLGQSYTIGRWVVRHSGEGYENPIYNTRDFKLQKSSDGINWTDVDTVTGNAANMTDRIVTPFNSRYVRLYITKATNSSEYHARIYEFELYAPGNIAHNKLATVSSSQSVFENESKALDGSIDTLWHSNNVAEPHWLQIDLGQVQDINKWIVKHYGSAGGDQSYNTSDFKLQRSTDGVNWIDVDTVTGNTDDVTYRRVQTFSSRYVRLYITKATNNTDTQARIVEFEVWAD